MFNNRRNVLQLKNVLCSFLWTYLVQFSFLIMLVVSLYGLYSIKFLNVFDYFFSKNFK